MSFEDWLQKGKENVLAMRDICTRVQTLRIPFDVMYTFLLSIHKIPLSSSSSGEKDLFPSYPLKHLQLDSDQQNRYPNLAPLLSAMVTAFPELEILRISSHHCHQKINRTQQCQKYHTYIGELMPVSPVPIFPHLLALSVDDWGFTDDFANALLKSCPQLHYVCLYILRRGPNPYDGLIQSRETLSQRVPSAEIGSFDCDGKGQPFGNINRCIGLHRIGTCKLVGEAFPFG